MHLNYNLGIRPNGHLSPQKVPPLCECLGSIPRITKFISLHFLSVPLLELFGFSLSPTVLFLLQVCINLYYILFLFAV
jgi:hypothetical protein